MLAGESGDRRRHVGEPVDGEDSQRDLAFGELFGELRHAPPHEFGADVGHVVLPPLAGREHEDREHPVGAGPAGRMQGGIVLDPQVVSEPHERAHRQASDSGRRPEPPR